MEKKYNIFICYRRDGASDVSRNLYDRLQKKYSVFRDVQEISDESGNFDNKLYKNIDQCSDFILCLPPNGLDRCSNEGDWVRREIKYALEHRKNIIPFLMPGFEMPATEDLPEDIREVALKNGINYDNDHFDDDFKKLLKMLKAKETSKIKCVPIIAVALVLVGVLFYLFRGTLITKINDNIRHTTERKYYSVYRDFLLEYDSSEESNNNETWGLFYLNDDNIPELFVTNHCLAGAGPKIYTIENQKVLQISDSDGMGGSYGSFLYAERDNCYVRLYSHSAFWLAEMYKMEGDSLSLEWKAVANRGYDETAIGLEFGDNELEEYKAYKESKGFELYSDVTEEVYELYCEYISDNNLNSNRKWRYDKTNSELWSDFHCQYKNSTETILSSEEFKKEYKKYLPDDLISVGTNNCTMFDENIENYCYEYEMNENDIKLALK